MTEWGWSGSSFEDMKTDSMRKLVALVVATGFVGMAPMAAVADETPLGEEMEKVSGALKSLWRLSKTDERWTASAVRMREAQTACIKALAHLPARIEEMPKGVEKAKAAADYKRLMGLSLALFAELEVAFMDEDEATVGELLDKVKDIKKEGHEKYEDDD